MPEAIDIILIPEALCQSAMGPMPEVPPNSNEHYPGESAERRCKICHLSLINAGDRMLDLISIDKKTQIELPIAQYAARVFGRHLLCRGELLNEDIFVHKTLKDFT